MLLDGGGCVRTRAKCLEGRANWELLALELLGEFWVSIERRRLQISGYKSLFTTPSPAPCSATSVIDEPDSWTAGSITVGGCLCVATISGLFIALTAHFSRVLCAGTVFASFMMLSAYFRTDTLMRPRNAMSVMSAAD